MSVRYKLEGVDGAVWEFGEPGCPLRLGSPPTGITGAKFSHVDQQNARQAGVSWRGLNNEPNFIGLDVHVGPVRAATAIALWKRWRRTLGRGRTLGVFHAISDEGGDRWQQVRLNELLAEGDLDKIENAGYTRERPVLRSDESWWRKAPVDKTFTPAQFAGASIVNAGDEKSWPRFEVTGPITAARIGVAGEAVLLGTVPAGQTYTVETDPEQAYIVDSTGKDIWWQVGDRHWYSPAPARAKDGTPTTVPVTITGTGTTDATRVRVILPQLFWEGV